MKCARPQCPRQGCKHRLPLESRASRRFCSDYCRLKDWSRRNPRKYVRIKAGKSLALQSA
jgi:hypothetical protein